MQMDELEVMENCVKQSFVDGLIFFVCVAFVFDKQLRVPYM